MLDLSANVLHIFHICKQKEKKVQDNRIKQHYTLYATHIVYKVYKSTA